MITESERHQIKAISIRGRFAYGLICLEKLAQQQGFNIKQFLELLDEMWQVTCSEKLGSWEDFLLANNPKVIIPDFEAFVQGRITFKQIGLNYFRNEAELFAKVDFLKALPQPALDLLEKLEEIANRNLFADTGRYSESTFQLFVEMLSVLDAIEGFQRPEIDCVAFSHFNHNYGWGHPFKKENIQKSLN